MTILIVNKINNDIDIGTGIYDYFLLISKKYLNNWMHIKLNKYHIKYLRLNNKKVIYYILTTCTIIIA